MPSYMFLTKTSAPYSSSTAINIPTARDSMYRSMDSTPPESSSPNAACPFNLKVLDTCALRYMPRELKRSQSVPLMTCGLTLRERSVRQLHPLIDQALLANAVYIESDYVKMRQNLVNLLAQLSNHPKVLWYRDPKTVHSFFQNIEDVTKGQYPVEYRSVHSPAGQIVPNKRVLEPLGIQTCSSTDTHHSLLHIAITTRNYRGAQTLLECGYPTNSMDPIGNTCIHILLQQPPSKLKQALLAYLLANKAEVNTYNQYKQAPVHLAVLHRDIYALKLLLQAGAAMNTPDAQGNTPLHLTVLDQNLNMVAYLVHKGACLYSRNTVGIGYAPLELANVSAKNENPFISARYKAYKLNRKNKIIKLIATKIIEHGSR